MRNEIDVDERTVSFELPKAVYSKDSLSIAAQVLGKRADVLLSQSAKNFELTLKAVRKNLDETQLRDLAGEFANEMLNQEYRLFVSRFNSKISNLIVTQTLFCARGGEKPPGTPPEEQTPQFKAEVKKLMAEADEEIKRTMPPKIAPQGNPIPPEKEDASV